MKVSSEQNDSSYLELNKLEVIAEIELEKKYSTEGITIIKWEEDTDETEKKLLANIKKDNFSFVGPLNMKLQKDGIGLMKYANDDRYFGMYQKDQRNRQGLYMYAPSTQDGSIKSEYYFGTWNNNIKHGRGIYMWLSEQENVTPFSDFDNADFDCFHGEVNNELLRKGTYMSKKNGEYFVYHGSINDKGEKHSDNAFYYNSTNDQLMYGSVRNDKFEKGFIALFDEDGNLTNIMEFELGTDGKVQQYKQKQEIENDKLEQITEDMTLFRNIILEEDYFGMVYNILKETTEIINEKMNGLDIYHAKDFADIVDASYKFNDMKLYEKVCKNLPSV